MSEKITEFVFPEGTKIDETVPEKARRLYQRFYIGPLERGFGHTIGNSLRRVLLSSIEGDAIVGVKIEGVPHEFSSIEGTRDDVTMIILHLKRVRLKIKGNKDFVRAEIKVDNTKSDSPKIVTAADIDGPVEVANPNQYITEVMPKYKFHCELFIGRGRGYVPADRVQSSFQFPAGTIPIDAIFNPIVKVNYEVRNTMYEERADYDELVIDIWSDGTKTPQEAYEESIDILIEHFRSLRNYVERGKYEKERKDIRVSNIEEFIKRDVQDMNLPRKTYEVLKMHGINTVYDVLKKTEKELLALPNLGRRSLKEIKEALARAGLELGMTDEQIQKAIEEEKKSRS
ncbi:MAG: DNA-directed RNA polymerase subunit alpha [Candidatus Calescibacterium sp.]